MGRSDDLPELSRSELDLMRILWKERRLSAREVHERLGATYDWAYSTTRTMLERMVGKGYLERASFHGVILYRPLISRPLGLAQLVRDFAERVLEGDNGSVVALFAQSSSLTESEVAELAGILEETDQHEELEEHDQLEETVSSRSGR
jgi:BlaI family transcriptional regulator, penicillinase repressor